MASLRSSLLASNQHTEACRFSTPNKSWHFTRTVKQDNETRRFEACVCLKSSLFKFWRGCIRRMRMRFLPWSASPPLNSNRKRTASRHFPYNHAFVDASYVTTWNPEFIAQMALSWRPLTADMWLFRACSVFTDLLTMSLFFSDGNLVVTAPHQYAGMSPQQYADQLVWTEPMRDSLNDASLATIHYAICYDFDYIALMSVRRVTRKWRAEDGENGKWAERRGARGEKEKGGKGGERRAEE